MDTHNKGVFALSIVTVLLAGCGGGGGGANIRGAVPFTSVSAITPGSTVQASGMSAETTYTYDAVNRKVTSRGTPTPHASGASVVIAYGSNFVPTSESATSAAGTSISLNTSNGDQIGVGFTDSTTNTTATYSVSADGKNIIYAAAAGNQGWNYQSYGTWITGLDTGSGTFGTFSIGAETSAANIPSNSTATYTGKSGGEYLAANGYYYRTGSTVTATADFGNRTLGITSTGTKIDRFGTTTTNNNLNFTGNLAYNAGSNQFTGNIATTGGLNGTMTGKFYGPSAEEIGGLFSASGAGLEMYGGAFGAKR